jgi:hypothetical protein
LQHYEHSLKIRAWTLKGQYEAVSLEGVQGAAEQVLHPESLTWLIVGEVQIIDVDGQIVE